MKFLIWSNQHKAYWRENACGYVRHRAEAGRYSLKEAENICQEANEHLREDAEPHETMLPAN